MITGTLFFAVEVNSATTETLQELSTKIEKAVKGLSNDIVSCEESDSDVQDDEESESEE